MGKLKRIVMQVEEDWAKFDPDEPEQIPEEVYREAIIAEAERLRKENSNAA